MVNNKIQQMVNNLFGLLIALGGLSILGFTGSLEMDAITCSEYVVICMLSVLIPVTVWGALTSLNTYITKKICG